ncbi:MAG: hypothetical protein AABZ60_10335 [Planctomycetota bacterium]
MQSRSSNFSDSSLPLPPFYLSHHYSEESERCLFFAGVYLCRRCLFLYPLTFLVMGLSLGSSWSWPREWDIFLLWWLPVPAVLEFSLDQLRKIAYRPWYQILTTLLLAPALGKGLARYLENQTDVLFWGMVLVHGGICFSALVFRKMKPNLPQKPTH